MSIKQKATEALKRAVSIPGKVVDSYVGGIKRVDAARQARDQKMEDDNFGPDYHERAQTFIKSAKENGMAVKAEGQELIAYPHEAPALGSAVKKVGDGVGKQSKAFPVPDVMKVGRRIIK